MEENIRSLITGSLRGEVLYDEPLSRHTSLKVGGLADLFVIPADLVDLRALLDLLSERGIPRLVIGGGYNLLVRDGGFIELCGLIKEKVREQSGIMLEEEVRIVGEP